MNAEFDYDLTPDQWETLKTLRLPAPRSRPLTKFVVENLVALQLATVIDECPVITPRGRKVLVRGSSRLWGVAA
jgi:hypothetical protein